MFQFDPKDRPCHRGILVLDYGSQYTLLIARRLREIGVYAEIIDARLDIPPADFEVDGVILSGGPDSVTDDESRRLPLWVLRSGKPVLGICYGMQLLVEHFGGQLQCGVRREFGKAKLILSSEMKERAANVFYGMPVGQTVWMSHGDDVAVMPSEFVAVGHTEAKVIAAVVHRSLPLIGLQFHPEVHHSEYGGLLLQQFVRSLCRAPLTWQPNSMLEAASKSVREQVGSGKVLMAVSGGIDSTVAAVLMARALEPDQLQTVFVDHGLLRKDEAYKVTELLRSVGIKKLEVLDRSTLFLNRLAGVSEPEEKRKIIGRSFIEVFEEFASTHKNFTHLGQGTLYPDVIESAGHGSGAKVIKSHHNVGGLPERLKLKLVEPFRFLFKDEVRSVGRELGLADDVIGRHPFPGPGLAVRVLGEVTAKRVAVLQEADHIFIQMLRGAGLYERAWQAFAVLLPVQTVGVMGDNRTYENVCALRAVSASDGMTADVTELPMDFLVRVADRIVREVRGINRVVYDVTTKPPATIEWE